MSGYIHYNISYTRADFFSSVGFSAIFLAPEMSGTRQLRQLETTMETKGRCTPGH